jgi:hypothetical protein
MPFVVQQTDSGLIGRPKLTCVTYTAAVVQSMARRWPLRCQLHQSVRASVDQTGAVGELLPHAGWIAHVSL